MSDESKPKRVFECVLCPRHPSDLDGQGSVYRVNPKGEAGIFACKDCLAEAQRLYAAGKLLPGGIVVN